MLARIPCFGCKYDGQGLTEHCQSCVESEEECYGGYSPKTNADLIRAMSDDDLLDELEWITAVIEDRDELREWLKQEVE